MEKVGMRGRHRESELVETPPHWAELGFSSVPCGPLPARGARSAAPRRGRNNNQIITLRLCGNERRLGFLYRLEDARRRLDATLPTLDPATQISGLRKFKLTSCAPIS